MIKYVSGNIFDAPVQTIVNPVNCKGVMGAGLAKQFKERYPDMFQVYLKACSANLLKPGKLMLYKASDHWIINFPTKDDWRNASEIRYIESGLQKFTQVYHDKGITSIAFPPLGCGLGGLDFSLVKLLMEKYLNDLPIEVLVYV